MAKSADEVGHMGDCMGLHMIILLGICIPVPFARALAPSVELACLMGCVHSCIMTFFSIVTGLLVKGTSVPHS